MSVARQWMCRRCANSQQFRPFSSTGSRSDTSTSMNLASSGASSFVPSSEQESSKDPAPSGPAASDVAKPQGRRARLALRRSQSPHNIPFEQLPYACFQEARKILAADRQEKIRQINVQRERIARLRAQETEPQSQASRERRLGSMEQHLEELKVWADINDPIVKKIYESGKGDFNKPVYRHLEEQKWRSYMRKIQVQRIDQFNLVPDVLQALDPSVSVVLQFSGKGILGGEYIHSSQSERAPAVKIQSFQKEERLVTIACVNPDIPNVSKDGFDYRGHFLACNIKVGPTTLPIDLTALDFSSQVVLPWLPAHTQKGAPYQRMAFFVIEQPGAVTIDVEAAKKKVKHANFNLRAIVDRYRLRPIGASLFRSQWDNGTAKVMEKLNIPGSDVEFKRMKIEPLPYKRLDGKRYR